MRTIKLCLHLRPTLVSGVVQAILLLSLMAAACGDIEIGIEQNVPPPSLPTDVVAPAITPEASPATPDTSATESPQSLAPTGQAVGSSPAAPTQEANVTNVEEPLLVDGEKGWIFAAAQVAGQPATVKLAAADGRLLASFDIVGNLALDRTHNRLFVDQGESGLAVLDAAAGTLLTSIPSPTGGEAKADPQVDPNTGLAYVSRGSTVFVVDAATGSVSNTVDVSVSRTTCGEQELNAEIERSFFDLVNRKLYLAFTTYVCTPWVHQTLVAYDASTLEELGRYDTEYGFQAVPFSDSLYGTTAGRLGRNISWAWNGRQAWFEEGFEGAPGLQGIVGDWGRQLIYEALNGQIRIITPYPRQVNGQVSMPALRGNVRLAGHDPITDLLYFLADGQLHVRPRSELVSIQGD